MNTMSGYLATLRTTVDAAVNLPRSTWAKIAAAATVGWVGAAAAMAALLGVLGVRWPGVIVTIVSIALVYFCASAWVAGASTEVVAHPRYRITHSVRAAAARYPKVLWAEAAVAVPILASFFPTVALALVAAAAYTDHVTAATAAAVGAVGCLAAATVFSVWWWARHCVAVQAAVLGEANPVSTSQRYTQGRLGATAGVAATVNVAVSTLFGVVFLFSVIIGVGLAAVGWVWLGVAVALLGRVTFSVVNAAVYHASVTCMYTHTGPRHGSAPPTT